MAYNAVVEKIVDVAPGIKEFTVAYNDREPDFTAGQFCVLGLEDENGKLINRAYSISSAPKEGKMSFYIVLVEGGQLTPRLFALKEGDDIFMGPKCAGHMTIEKAKEAKRFIFVASGTGIASFRSLIIEHEDFFKNKKIALLHGVRKSCDLGYKDEMNERMKKYPESFHYFPVVSRAEEGEKWNGLNGRVNMVAENGLIQKAWGEELTPEHTHVYFCGNPKMVEDMSKFFEEKGFAKETLHKEAY